MEITEQIKLKFLGVEIIKVEYDLIKALSDRMPAKESKINLNVIPKVFYPLGYPQLFSIVMQVNVEAINDFSLKILAVGKFEINHKSIEEKIKKSFINKNAPAIMFPFVRSFISTLTANLGTKFGSLLIPPQFFQGEIEEIVDTIENS